MLWFFLRAARACGSLTCGILIKLISTKQDPNSETRWPFFACVLFCWWILLCVYYIDAFEIGENSYV